MPSIYPQLKASDRKHIRTEKAHIRKQFLDVKKQEEMIDALYKKMLGTSPDQKAAEKPAEKVEAPKVQKATKVVKKTAKVKAK